MKRLGLILLMQCLFVHSFAQFSISGKVMSESGEELVGASLVLSGTYMGTSADVDGTYRFKKVKAGDYTLRVSYMGYEAQSLSLKVTKDIVRDVTLAPLDILAEEVIVSATRAGAKTPVAVFDLNREDIESQASGQDIPYLLGLSPSVVTSSEAGTGIGYSALRIRGTDPSRINVTVNGVPLNDSESQGTFWVNMPDFASSVDNVQIQRGVGTSTNGAAAFGATINFQTETFNADPYAEVQSLIGSFGTNKNSVKAGTGLIDGKFTVDARYSKLNSDGYVDYAFVDHESYFISAAYYTEKSIIKANIISGDQRTGISWWGNPNPEEDRRYNPAGEYTDEFGNKQYYKDQTDNYFQDHYQVFYSSQVNPFTNLNVGLHYTAGEGYYEQYKEDESYADYGLDKVILGDQTLEETDLIRRKWLDNDFYGATFSLNYNRNKLDASFGGAWNKYDGDHFGEIIWMRNAGNTEKDHEWYSNVGEKTDFNVFGKLNYQLTKKLNVYGDLQYRRINYEMSGQDDDLITLDQTHEYDFFNPKMGLFYELAQNQETYFSFGTGHREPTRTNFKEAIKKDIIVLPKSETLYDYELGYKYSATKVAFGVNLYYMYYRDQLVPTGEKNNVGNSIMTNVDKSYRAGIEFVGGVKIFNNLNWDFNFTLSSNKIKDYVEYSTYYDEEWNESEEAKYLGTTNIAYSPETMGSSILAYKPGQVLKFSLITKYVGKQYFDNTSSEDRKIDAYLVNNLRADLTLKESFFSKINLFVQVNNLLDDKYSNNGYGGNWYEQGVEKTWEYYYPQAGINLMTGLTLTF
ncbi:TonB-dependent receptor [Sunxiuqinia sp. sy24]|uniref:TonB-dependent receptor n=1 Tax=Sunxiuqinia sp. sy24 TaxID=3461495 RepID=UPI0040454D24